jgi:ribonuclease HI
VVVVGDASHEELSEYLGQGTNNIAELTAILRGVEMVGERAGKLVIHTDSQYAIGVLSKGWKAKANVELVARIKEALRRRGRVELRYVKGHAGIPLNERCDELAREAVLRRRTHRETRGKRVSA